MPDLGTEIVIPGSIGNVGPGLDTLGLAIALYLRVRITRIVRDGRGEVAFRFLDEAPFGDNRIRDAFEFADRRKRRHGSIEVEVRSRIPQRAGLGSSAAATVAGLRLRDLVNGKARSAAELLAAGTALEGHPDNVAAVLFGGLTSSCAVSSGRIMTGRWDWPRAWKLVVATPRRKLQTAVSRRALPDALPLAHVIFNLQRVGMLLHAVQSRRDDDLREALADRVHQPYRARLVPGLRAALAFQHPDLIGACLGGSGPSVVFFARRNVAAVRRAVEKLYERERIRCTVRALRVHQP
jgi:homoserine kinase